MPKIDLSQFENYATLSAEEKVALFENYEVPEQTAPSADEISRLKNAISKANAESAEYKRQLREKQTEQERLDAERAEREQAREARLAELERANALGEVKAMALALGYTPELADAYAKAEVDNDRQQKFAIQAQFLENKSKQLQAEALNNQPTLSNGNPLVPPAPEDATVAAFRKAMGLA